MRARILVAPTAFKGTLTPARAAEAIRAGFAASGAALEPSGLPVSDGGDGLLDVLLGGLNGRRRSTSVTGPLGERVEAEWALLPDRTAVIEMAEAAGLRLLRTEARDPLRATTRGVGELLLEAARAGAGRAVVGVGGSATVDGGAGVAQALGVRLLDEAGREVGPGGGELSRVRRLDPAGLDPRARAMEIQVACDVANPLLGGRGAARVFAPQKGAGPGAVELLEQGLAHLADLFARDLGREVRESPGAGAAGGLGAGLAAFLGAQLLPGARLVLDLLGFDARLREADLVVTGEGRLDSQTAFGKAPAEVARRAARAGVPCVALVGSLEKGLDPAALGLAAAWGVVAPGGPVPADPAAALRDLAQEKAREILALARRAGGAGGAV